MNAIYGWSAGRRYALSVGGVLLATLMLTQLSADFQVTNIALLYLLVATTLRCRSWVQISRAAQA